MRLLYLFALALVAASLSITAEAGAQAAVLGVGPPTWNMRTRTDGELTQVNRQDCLDNATITFPITRTARESGTFEVWSGADCTNKDARQMNSTCVQVFTGELTVESVEVRVQDMLQPYNDTTLGVGSGTDATCDSSTSSTGGERTLFFMIVDSNLDAFEPQQWKFTFDTVPPDPPTGLSGGPGEASVVVDFEATKATDLKGYRIYCSDVAAEEPAEMGAGGGPDSATSADGSCTSTVLIPGKHATVDECGSVDGKSVSEIVGEKDVSNGVLYAAAIASVDELGNVGVLSEIVCATPKEATGYFEAYRAAGGKCGGGFCSFGPATRGTFAMAFALAALGLAVARRRR